MAGYLAQAGVSEAAIAVGPGPASSVQDELARCSGCPLLAISLSGPLPLAVYAFGIQQGKTRILWMVNRTERPQLVVVEKLRKAAALPMSRLNAATLPLKGFAESLATTSRAGSLDLTMEPYEVCRLALDAR